jgi:nitroreductase
METFEAIRTVLAVRRFEETLIPDPLVRQIVEAGRLTASSMNGQPWHFIIVQNKETLHHLGRLAPTGPYIAQAPWRSLLLWKAAPLLSPAPVVLSSP